MRPIRLFKSTPSIPFMPYRGIFALVSGFLVTTSILLAAFVGLNFGIDFRGGTLMEVRMPEPVAVAEVRDQLGGLGLGDVSIQEFGEPTDILIRVQRQEDLDESQAEVIETVRASLDPAAEFRRIEFVGPTVGAELRQQGAIAVLLALGAILLYIWFRFEWQFGVGAIIALAHDVVATIGIFALTQIEFNLSTVAAILTIAGYSINDTVVVFDRVRENLRRYKSLPMAELLNRSINETVSRTVVTSVTTLLALFSLYILGGEVIRGFTFGMIWGVIIGTYSSACVAVPLLLWIGVRTSRDDAGEEEAEAATTS